MFVCVCYSARVYQLQQTLSTCRLPVCPCMWLQHKELEAQVKQLQEEKAAAALKAEEAGQDILRLEAELTAAEEQRKALRKQLAQVCGVVW